jgi:hypothetical protein
LTDQLLAFVSPEHAKAIVWKSDVVAQPDEDDSESAGSNSDSDDSDDDESHDRFFEFSVDKTAEQEEGVVMRRGFEVRTCVPLVLRRTDFNPCADSQR